MLTSSQRLARSEPGRVRVGQLVDQGDGRMRGRGRRRCPSPRRRRRGTRRAAAGTISSPSSSFSVSGSAVRLDEPDDEVRPARRSGDGPPRASGRSCRRPAPCRGRPAAGRDRARRSPAPMRASISSAGRAVVVGVTSGSVTDATSSSHGPAASLTIVSRGQQAVQVQVEQQDVDPRLAEEAEQRLFGVASDRGRGRRPRTCRAPWRRARPGTRPRRG